MKSLTDSTKFAQINLELMSFLIGFRFVWLEQPNYQPNVDNVSLNPNASESDKAAKKFDHFCMDERLFNSWLTHAALITAMMCNMPCQITE